MPKANIILFLIFFSQNAFCQTLLEKLWNEAKESKSVPELATKSGFIKANLLKRGAEVREFGMQYFEEWFSAESLKSVTSINTTKVHYSIRVCAKNDSIFLLKIDSLIWNNENTKFKTIHVKIDTATALSFLYSHNSKYFSSWGIEDLLKIGEFGTWGYMTAGYFPLLNDDALKLAKYVVFKDRTKLLNLASSISSYDRAWGTAGLYFIKQFGEDLNEIEEALISLNQKSSIRLATSDGGYLHYELMSDCLIETVLLQWWFAFCNRNLFDQALKSKK